jgi:hypothetical protein
VVCLRDRTALPPLWTKGSALGSPAFVVEGVLQLRDSRRFENSQIRDKEPLWRPVSVSYCWVVACQREKMPCEQAAPLRSCDPVSGTNRSQQEATRTDNYELKLTEQRSQKKEKLIEQQPNSHLWKIDPLD